MPMQYLDFNNLPEDLQSSGLWDLHNMIANESIDDLQVTQEQKDLALALIKTQMHIYYNRDFIIQLRNLFQSEHDPYTGFRQQQEVVLRDERVSGPVPHDHHAIAGREEWIQGELRQDIIRAPFFTHRYYKPYSLAIHVDSSFPLGLVNIESEKVILELHAESIKELADPNDKRSVMQAFIKGADLQGGVGCASERMMSVNTHVSQALQKIDDRIAADGKVISIEDFIDFTKHDSATDNALIEGLYNEANFNTAYYTQVYDILVRNNYKSLKLSSTDSLLVDDANKISIMRAIAFKVKAVGMLDIEDSEILNLGAVHPSAPSATPVKPRVAFKSTAEVHTYAPYSSSRPSVPPVPMRYPMGGSGGQQPPKAADNVFITPFRIGAIVGLAVTAIVGTAVLTFIAVPSLMPALGLTGAAVLAKLTGIGVASTSMVAAKSLALTASASMFTGLAAAGITAAVQADDDISAVRPAV